jgi:tetratricopeptide (TPR) repeat protein
MSVVRYQLSNLSKAIEYELKALDIVKNIGNKRGESVCYINLGLAYRNLGEYSKAIEYQIKALEITKQIGNISDESTVNLALGHKIPAAFFALGNRLQTLFYSPC